MDFFRQLFDTSDYPARWACGNWAPFEGWLHIVSDLLIFCAYSAIPAALGILLIRRRNITFPVIGWLFVAFILSCGITHAVEASIFWWPAYRFSGVLKALTAGLSLATAMAVIRVLPQAITLPNIHRSNEELSAALTRERDLSEQVQTAHKTLEERTSALTVRERRMREAVGAAKAFAVRWDVTTGEILWEMGFTEAMRSASLRWGKDLRHWADLIATPDVSSLLLESHRRAVAKQTFHARYDLLGHEGDWDIRMTASPDPVVKGHPLTMSGLIGLVPTADSRTRTEPGK